MKEFRNRQINTLRDESVYSPARENFILMKRYKKSIPRTIYLIDTQNQKNDPKYGKNFIFTFMVNLDIIEFRWEIKLGKGGISYTPRSANYHLKVFKRGTSILQLNSKRGCRSIRSY